MATTRALRLPKSRRLTLPSEFERVRKEGRAERGKLLIVSVLPALATGRVRPTGGQDRHRLRAGFVTSKRVGAAVVRNRVRRRLREIVRRHQQDLVSDFWVVTVARPAAVSASYQELEDEWLRLAKRAFILAA